MVRRVRPVEVGKAGEEQLGGEVVKGEVLLLIAARDVAPVGRWCKGGVGAGIEVEMIFLTVMILMYLVSVMMPSTSGGIHTSRVMIICQGPNSPSSTRQSS